MSAARSQYRARGALSRRRSRPRNRAQTRTAKPVPSLRGTPVTALSSHSQLWAGFPDSFLSQASRVRMFASCDHASTSHHPPTQRRTEGALAPQSRTGTATLAHDDARAPSWATRADGSAGDCPCDYSLRAPSREAASQDARAPRARHIACRPSACDRSPRAPSWAHRGQHALMALVIAPRYCSLRAPSRETGGLARSSQHARALRGLGTSPHRPIACDCSLRAPP